jgi:hypothetical protein
MHWINGLNQQNNFFSQVNFFPLGSQTEMCNVFLTETHAEKLNF